MLLYNLSKILINIFISYQMKSELEKLKAQSEQLSKELAASIHSRRNMEDENNKARIEMRAQMDRMRSTMHDLLKKGGEETEVIQTQCVDLQSVF